MKKKRTIRDGENLFTWLILVFSLFVLFSAYKISGFSSISSPGTFPMASSAIMVLTSIILLIGNRDAAKPESPDFITEIRRAAKDVFNPAFLIYTALIIAYMVALEPFHFLSSSLVFLLISIIFLKGARPLKAVFISVGTLGGIYVVFHCLFRVVLP